MLSAVRNGEKWEVEMNFSSLDLIQTCRRKAQLVLQKKLTRIHEAEATLFGTAIHKGLETWYSSSRDERPRSSGHCDDEQAGLIATQGTQCSAHSLECLRCKSVQAFIQAAQPLALLGPESKRSVESGVAILNAYFSLYHDDPYVVFRDKEGPVVERLLETTLYDSSFLKVTYFGTIDVVLQNVLTGQALVTDHKTTSSLGKDFLNRLKPNHQYTGYVYLGQKELGLDTEEFLVNGIFVGKSRNFSRQITSRNPGDVAELKDAVVQAAQDYVNALETGRWPQTSPGPCSNWGGCQFLEVCRAPAGPIRESLETNLFNTTEGSEE
jgi:hypothetical protein